MGVIVEFYAMEEPSPESGIHEVDVEHIQEHGTLVGDCSLNSAAMGEFADWLGGTPLRGMLSDLEFTSAAVVIPAGGIDPLLSILRANLEPAGAVFVEALEEAAEELEYREASVLAIVMA